MKYIYEYRAFGRPPRCRLASIVFAAILVCGGVEKPQSPIVSKIEHLLRCYQVELYSTLTVGSTVGSIGLPSTTALVASARRGAPTR